MPGCLKLALSFSLREGMSSSPSLKIAGPLYPWVQCLWVPCLQIQLIRTENSWKKICICTEHVQPFSLSLFPKQYHKQLFTLCHLSRDDFHMREDVWRLCGSTTALYIRHLNICGFWCPEVSWNQSPADNQGQLCSIFNLERTFPVGDMASRSFSFLSFSC